jgi:hypothetical protein
MPRITRYRESDGQILGQMTCNESVMNLNKPFIMGHWDAESYRVSNGRPVKKSKGELERRVLERKRSELEIFVKGLLRDSDWTQMPDVPLSKEKKKEWKDYRQALRDLPHRTEDPRKLKMPRKPDD